MIKDRQRGGVRFICEGDVVGEASREAPVRTEPHPTSQPALVFDRHPIKIENEHENEFGEGIEKANESELTKYHWTILRKWGD